MAAPPLNAAGGGPRVPLSRGDIILALVGAYLSFADRLALRLVCRDWRRSCRRLGGVAPPPFPWLMLPPLAAPRGTAAHAPPPPRRRFYDIPGGRAYAYDVPAYHRCVATGGGWLVLAAVDPPRRLVLANPITGARRVLAWPFGEKGSEGIRAALTSSPADPACFLAVATDRLIAYCRPGRAGGGGWATLRAPGYRHDTIASDMVAVGSAVYLVDERRKIWRADLAAAEPKVERRDTAFGLPEEGEEDRWSHYLVEAFGNVHLVVSDERHRRLALFRLNWHPRTWVPSDASVLGDRVLLLGHGCSAAVPASAAAGRAPGTVLFARQPLETLHVGADIRDPAGAQQWFWSELRLDAGVDDPIVMRKTVPHWPGFFTAGDSFWFFPGIDRGA
ncbi:hypothetical protein EJB05_52922, partial [Eragrostis curvula]